MSRKRSTTENLGLYKIYRNYLASSKRRKLVFALSQDELRALIAKDCVYCGKPASESNSVKTRYGVFRYNGVDRIDNNIGYTLENSVPSCSDCNSMKGTKSAENFLEKVISISRSKLFNNKSIERKLSYYHARAIAASALSHDQETKVGALLLNPKTGAVMAEGYNGFVRGAPDASLPATRPEKYDYMVHAEINLICNAVRHGVKTDEAIIYCTLSPCVRCLRTIWQCGVSKIYFKDKYKDFEQNINMQDLSISVRETSEGFHEISLKARS